MVPGPLLEGGVIEYLALCGEFARARGLGERLVARLPDVDTGAVRLAWDEAFSLGNCHYGLMLADLYQGEPASAARAAARARVCYGHIGWERMVVSVVRMECLSALAYAADRPDEWRRLAAEWDVHESRVGRPGVGDAPRPGHAMVLAAGGRWDEARTLTAAMLDDLRLLQRQGAQLVIAELDRACGETEAAWVAVRAVLPEGPTAALVAQYRVQEPALRLGAALAVDEGDLPTAATWLAAHDALLARCAGVLGRSENHALWGRYHRQSGERGKARECAERALACAMEPRQPLALLQAHRLLGELHTDTGEYEAARHHLTESLAIAAACEAPFERALNLLALAESHAAQGETGMAQPLVDEVRVICESLSAKPALGRAEALAGRLDTASASTPSYPAGLSAREVQVLKLVAEGLSNPQVGERLFLSPRTVEQHLRSIFNKTGVPSRAAAARWATEQGLV
jgi:DNA-binding CsgD family transcriptional regulator